MEELNAVLGNILADPAKLGQLRQAAQTLGLAPQEAAALGNCVSSITIQQIGRTGTATRQQVAQRLRTRA